MIGEAPEAVAGHFRSVRSPLSRYLSTHLYQHHVAAVAFYQRGNLAVLAAAQQIPFPVPWYRTFLNAGWPFADGNRIADAAMVVGFLGVMARAAHGPAAAQMLSVLRSQVESTTVSSRS